VTPLTLTGNIEEQTERGRFKVTEREGGKVKQKEKLDKEKRVTDQTSRGNDTERQH
jgi:hypothetical protein